MILNYNYCLKAEGALRSRDRIEDIVGREFSDSVRLLPPIYLIVGMIQNCFLCGQLPVRWQSLAAPTIMGKVGAPTITGKVWRSCDRGQVFGAPTISPFSSLQRPRNLPIGRQ